MAARNWFRAEHSADSRQAADDSAGNNRRAGPFRVQDVRRRIAKNLIAGAAVDRTGDQRRHRAGGNKQGRLFAE